MKGRFPAALAQVVLRGSIPDVQIADDKHWFAWTDWTALSFTQ